MELLPDSLIATLIARAPALGACNRRCWQVVMSERPKIIADRPFWHVSSLAHLRVLVRLGGADQLLLREWLELALTHLTIDHCWVGIRLLNCYGVQPTTDDRELVRQLADGRTMYTQLSTDEVIASDNLRTLTRSLIPPTTEPRPTWSDVVDSGSRESITDDVARWLLESKIGHPYRLTYCLGLFIECYARRIISHLTTTNRNMIVPTLVMCAQRAARGPYVWKAINVAYQLIKKSVTSDFNSISGPEAALCLSSFPIMIRRRLQELLPLDSRSMITYSGHHRTYCKLSDKCNYRKILLRMVNGSDIDVTQIEGILTSHPTAYTARTIRRISQPTVLKCLESWWSRVASGTLPVAKRGFWGRVQVAHDHQPMLERLYTLAGQPSIPDVQQRTVFTRYRSSPTCLYWLVSKNLLSCTGQSLTFQCFLSGWSKYLQWWTLIHWSTNEQLNRVERVITDPIIIDFIRRRIRVSE